MNADFARNLSLLRREKKISQRKVAAQLGISQALLSHYENGVREPGLVFVLAAADFYGVSCDFLLGRTLSRDGTTISAQELGDVSQEKGNVLQGSVYVMLQKKLIVNSAALLMELSGKTGSRDLVTYNSMYMSAAIYRLYRYLHHAGGLGDEKTFAEPYELVGSACDVMMKKAEYELMELMRSDALEAAPSEEMRALLTSNPSLQQSLNSLLHSVSDQMAKECGK